MTAAAESAPPRGGLIGWGRCDRPAIGVAAVLLGAFVSTLNVRITSFGLADIRGALGLSFDEGAWVSTAFTASQMVVAPAAAWMSTVLSTRRVLLWTGAVFTLASVFPPLTRDFGAVVALQIVRGLAVGAFIPAALGFILRSLAPRWWIWGIAAYAFRFVFSQNIGGSIEAVYSETGNWPWIFWQNVLITPFMVWLAGISMPHRPVDRALLAHTDWAGIAFAGLGFGAIYIALDQGNRLDWFNSGTVTGLMVAGGLLVAAFVIQEARSEFPLIHLRVLVSRNIALPSILIAIFGFGVTATAFVLPDYMTRVQGLRTLQISDTLNWIALPQLVIVPLVALMLKRIDARILLVFGFAMIAVGAWMNVGITHDWADPEFIPSQCVEAVGLAFAITSLITFAVANVTPPQAAAIAATVQTARLFGNEVGQGIMQTFVRVKEQTYSHLIGWHVVSGASATEGVTGQLAGPFANRQTGLGTAASQGVAVLAAQVQREAYVLAYSDAFWLIAWVSLAGILLVALLKPPPPNPITPPRIDLPRR